MGKVYRRVFAVIACICLALGVPLTAYGAYVVAGDTVSYVSTVDYGSEIIEEYNPPEYVQPGEYVQKVVNVKNCGESKILVRVKLIREFSRAGLNPEMILLHTDDKHWVQDGEWYYYKGILDKGESTKYPLLRGFTLSIDAGNEYKSTDGSIIVVSETLQYEGNFAEQAWGISYEEMGIESPESVNVDLGRSRVEFTGPRFLFNHKNGDDLFLNFKKLLPGQVRTQAVQVVNRSNNPTNIDLCYMYSEDADEKLRDLMRQYIYIVIKDMEGNVIYDGGIDAELHNSIPLGNFGVGETKELIVSAQVSPDLSAEYRGLKGTVKWGFTVSGEGSTRRVEDYFAKTGDSYFLLYLGVVLVVMGSILLYLCVRGKVEVDKE